MLHTLTIRDLALIEHAEISLDSAFNVISGETGGGKSLVIASLELLRGCRARSDMVRHGADELRVDGEFRLGPGDRSKSVREAVEGLLAGDGEDLLIVTRIVDGNGRSRARINGRPVTLAVLREVGGWLLEIHGQGDARALMRPEIQCETLDAFAGTGDLRKQFGRALTVARECRDRLAELAGGERDRQSRIEFLRFQQAEMEDLGLEAGEVAALEQEHRILAHLDRMRDYLTTVLGNLQENDPCATDLLGQATRTLGQAAEIDHGLADAAASLAEAEIHVTEASRAVESGLARLDLDPGRLATVEERLEQLRRALSRFGPTEADFAARLQEVGDELETLTGDAASPDQLSREFESKLEVTAKLGKKLVRARRKASSRFSEAVEAELESLGMSSVELRVAMEDEFETSTLLDAATTHGPTTVDFTVRINPGEPDKSMRETASGGEMARIVLAIKKCLADQDRVPFLVFDEVDAEIGGRLGFEVGTKLSDVSQHHQVLIVTHLPQVAAFADAHFKVMKTVRDGRTISGVARLAKKDAEREIAEMSVGADVDAEALREARRMVRRATARD